MISHVSRFINLEDKKFFTVPKPFSNELLSSWLIRVALAHDTQPRTFMNLHFPKTNPNFWSKDVDIYWGQNTSFLSQLSHKSNIPVRKLYRMTLQSYTGYLSEKIRINGHNKSITRIKNRGRTHHSYGVRFCPQCIKNDPIPYYRKHWRLSFVTCCTKHRCYLQDRCPQCHKPITPYIVREKNEYFYCNSCKSPLYTASTKKIPKESYGMLAQDHLLATVTSGYFCFEKENYYSLAYFPVLHQITKLLYNSCYHKSAFDHEVLYASTALPIFKKKPSFFIEDRSIHEQYLIYSAAQYLLESSTRIKKFCHANRIGKGLLTHSLKYIPFWFTHIISENDHSSYSVALDEVKSLIVYLNRNHRPISFKSLSKYLNVTIDPRKRPDILEIL